MADWAQASGFDWDNGNSRKMREHMMLANQKQNKYFLTSLFWYWKIVSIARKKAAIML